jgi:hypothetical protein
VLQYAKTSRSRWVTWMTPTPCFTTRSTR